MAIGLIYNVGILFLMMLPGLIMVKTKLAGEGFGKSVSNLVLYIAQPALIIKAYIRPYEETVVQNAIWVLVLAFFSHAFFALVAFLIYRNNIEEGKRRVLRFATIFSNAAFMGIPLIVGVLNEEAAIYASIYSIAFNFFSWSLGVYIFTGDKKQASFTRVLLHPVTISSIVGVLIFLLPIDGYIPTLAVEALDMLAALVAPLSMLVIGLRLASLDLRGIFNDKWLYIYLSLRLVGLPFVIFLVMKLLSLLSLPINATVMTVIFICSATPAATATSMFSERYDGDAPYAGKLVALSTILSVVTMPLLSLLLNI